MQRKNYQAFEYTQNYCHRSAECVKCSKSHRTADCLIPKTSKATCANCDENHTANWKGSMLIKIKHKKRIPKKNHC